MGTPTLSEPLLKTLRRSGGSAITLEEAAWLVWPAEPRSGVSAAMSQAQFVHLGAPVVAVQTGGRMEYFDEDGALGWTSNLAWPRANLEMARLPGRPDVLKERSPEKSSPEESSTEEGSSEADSPIEDSRADANEDNSKSTDEPNE